jgi:hypothetical protein
VNQPQCITIVIIDEAASVVSEGERAFDLDKDTLITDHTCFGGSSDGIYPWSGPRWLDLTQFSTVGIIDQLVMSSIRR